MEHFGRESLSILSFVSLEWENTFTCFKLANLTFLPYFLFFQDKIFPYIVIYFMKWLKTRSLGILILNLERTYNQIMLS
jgi:hypothetical protein